MTIPRLQRLIDVWRSDLDRWPPRERAFAERMLADPVARALLEQAKILDQAISRAEMAAKVPDYAVHRVLAGLRTRPLPPQKQPLLSQWRVGAAANPWVTWPRFAALACGATLGVVVGLSSLGMRMATSLDLNLTQTVSADTGLSGGLFDADSVTGLGP
jgi:hypothetical protein